jgi:hypothetical protein
MVSWGGYVLGSILARKGEKKVWTFPFIMNIYAKALRNKPLIYKRTVHGGNETNKVPRQKYIQHMRVRWVGGLCVCTCMCDQLS